MTITDDRLTPEYVFELAQDGDLFDYTNLLREEVLRLRTENADLRRVGVVKLCELDSAAGGARPPHIIRLLKRAQQICEEENIDVGLDPSPEFVEMACGPVDSPKPTYRHDGDVSRELALMGALGVFAKDVYLLGQYDARTHVCWSCMQNGGSRRTYTFEEFKVHAKECSHGTMRKVLAILDNDKGDHSGMVVEIRALFDAWLAST